MSRRRTDDRTPDPFSTEPIGKTSSDQLSANVTVTQKSSSRSIVPRDLHKSITYLDDHEFKRLFEAVAPLTLGFLTPGSTGALLTHAWTVVSEALQSFLGRLASQSRSDTYYRHRRRRRFGRFAIKPLLTVLSAVQGPSSKLVATGQHAHGNVETLHCSFSVPVSPSFLQV
jgi:hypothetical protein